MAAKIQGRMGMTKKLKKAARRQGMQSNRKRDKAGWRSRYHREFDNAKGPSPMDQAKLGFTAQHVAPPKKAEAK